MKYYEPYRPEWLTNLIEQNQQRLGNFIILQALGRGMSLIDVKEKDADGNKYTDE